MSAKSEAEAEPTNETCCRRTVHGSRVCGRGQAPKPRSRASETPGLRSVTYRGTIDPPFGRSSHLTCPTDRVPICTQQARAAGSPSVTAPDRQCAALSNGGWQFQPPSLGLSVTHRPGSSAPHAWPRQGNAMHITCPNAGVTVVLGSSTGASVADRRPTEHCFGLSVPFAPPRLRYHTRTCNARRTERTIARTDGAARTIIRPRPPQRCGGCEVDHCYSVGARVPSWERSLEESLLCKRSHC